MKTKDIERLVSLLEQFKTVVPLRAVDIVRVQTLAENEVFELKRRGKKKTPAQ